VTKLVGIGRVSVVGSVVVAEAVLRRLFGVLLIVTAGQIVWRARRRS
jgi:uncharacterized membrane protein YfcA